MFGYVPRYKVQQLVRAYEQLLRLHDLRATYPRDWLAVNARIGDLRDDLKINNERPSST